MITEQELKTFETNCVNIGFSMCQAESVTALRELIRQCNSKEELEILRKAKDTILQLKCVWKRQDS